LLQLISAAVSCQVDLVQIREKQLTARTLFELAVAAARFTRAGNTKLLINDRADIAAASGADGVHLTTRSLPPDVVRQTFGEGMLIGVSTHSLDEAVSARQNGADFIVFGPIFETGSKKVYGAPVGLNELKRICGALSPFPVLALGGVSISNAAPCIHAGARGLAGITMLNNPKTLADVVTEIRRGFAEVTAT
jgi:thiamine-phosphate pyrophosphorylase